MIWYPIGIISYWYIIHISIWYIIHILFMLEYIHIYQISYWYDNTNMILVYDYINRYRPV